jgi:hypothetical protein
VISIVSIATTFANKHILLLAIVGMSVAAISTLLRGMMSWNFEKSFSSSIVICQRNLVTFEVARQLKTDS